MKEKDNKIIKKAYTINEFCEAYRICRTKFYRLKEEDLAPTMICLKKKWLISIEDAEKWFEG